MKKIFLNMVIFTAALCLSVTGLAFHHYNKPLKIGHEAPNFTGTTDTGGTFKLDNHHGKIIVLEWTNVECPFVKKHYVHSNNMQMLQKKYTKKGVIWARIISSAKGKQGYQTSAEAKSWTKKHKVYATYTILDSKGKIGRKYDAKTTPEIFIINKKGDLVYQGAIDSKRSTNTKDIKGATNYATTTLNELLKNKKVTTTQTKPYGCSIKY